MVTSTLCWESVLVYCVPPLGRAEIEKINRSIINSNSIRTSYKFVVNWRHCKLMKPKTVTKLAIRRVW
jgi:hypothetical protein